MNLVIAIPPVQGEVFTQEAAEKLTDTETDLVIMDRRVKAKITGAVITSTGELMWVQLEFPRQLPAESE